MKKTLALTIVIGIPITIVMADLIIDAITTTKSLAFTYRLISNIGIVIIFAIIYWRKK